MTGCKLMSQGAKQQETQSGLRDVSRGMDLFNRQVLNNGAAFTKEEPSERGETLSVSNFLGRN